MGLKSAALFGDGPVDLTTLRDRLAQGLSTPSARAPVEAEAVSPATNERTTRLGLRFWLTVAAAAVLVAAIVLQLATARRRRRRRRHVRRLA